MMSLVIAKCSTKGAIIKWPINGAIAEEAVVTSIGEPNSAIFRTESKGC